LNESAWLKIPPPPEIIAWMSQGLGMAVEPLTPKEWKGLLAAAGLREVAGKTCSVDVKKRIKGNPQAIWMPRLAGRFREDPAAVSSKPGL
jgi:hypothetical protein